MLFCDKEESFFWEQAYTTALAAFADLEGIDDPHNAAVETADKAVYARRVRAHGIQS